MSSQITFETFLSQHDEEAWSATLTTLLRSVHEVDRNAVQIWFAFYPLALFQALAQSDDRETLAQRLLMQGNFNLKDQIDSSHTFLYGHRYWPQVKAAVQKYASTSGNEKTLLSDQIISVAKRWQRSEGRSVTSCWYHRAGVYDRAAGWTSRVQYSGQSPHR